MQLRNRQDFWSGMMFIILGLGFSWQASSYQMGTAARMGPGTSPSGWDSSLPCWARSS